MPDANDSSDFLDNTRKEGSAASRPLGSHLRPRHHLSLTESVDDYADLFRALQIRPEMHELFLEGLLKKVRRKHIKELQTGTEASIRGLTRLVLRGYRSIVWDEDSEWLLEEENLAEGEERLLHGGENERFYPLFELVWWRMRELLFEPKPPSKNRPPRKKDGHKGGDAEDAYEVSSVERQKFIANISKALLGPRRVVRSGWGLVSYFNGTTTSQGTKLTRRVEMQADADTEVDVRTYHDRVKDQTLRKINKLIASAPEPRHRYMSADETDKAIFDLFVQLSDIRARSEPDVFDRMWDQHIGRLDETENHPNNGQADLVARTTDIDMDYYEQIEPANTPSDAAVPAYSNLSNEPFATAGNPLPQSWPRPLPPQIPAAMAVYITTAPAESPYTNQAYEWVDAPVRLVDQRTFYNGVMLRVNMREENVRGFVMSYGWCDVCRWVSKGIEGEKGSWDVLQKDLARAAQKGVRVWRMKVFVVDSQV